MKRFLAISFLVLYVITTTELNQLLKFPTFIEHFKEHRQLDESVSLGDFLYMHYTDNDINDSDDDKDMQLPFKSHNDFISINFSSVPVNQRVVDLVVLPTFTERLKVKSYLNFKSSFLSSIWQPPKIS